MKFNQNVETFLQENFYESIFNNYRLFCPAQYVENKKSITRNVNYTHW